MELNEQTTKNIMLGVIHEMAEREIAYKQSINERIKGIRLRQIISIILSVLVLSVLSIILVIVMQNTKSTDALLRTLIGIFSHLNE